MLGYGRLIIFAIPEIGLILPAVISGLYGLYSSIEGGTLTDYQDAIDDPVLWSELTCAIYTATSGDGQITDSNFPDVQAAVAALSYTHAEVITTISQYLSDLGASGVQQLQTPGALAVYDCTSCGSGVSTGPGRPPYPAERRQRDRDDPLRHGLDHRRCCVCAAIRCAADRHPPVTGSGADCLR